MKVFVLEQPSASNSLQVEEAGSSKSLLLSHQTAKHNNPEYMILMEIAGATTYKMVYNMINKKTTVTTRRK
jgi:hypothetical protein